MQAHVCCFIDFLARGRSVIRTPLFRRTGRHVHTCYCALPVALARRQRQRVRVMRGGHAASRNEVDDTTGLPAIADAPPWREIRDRPTRHAAATPGPVRDGQALRYDDVTTARGSPAFDVTFRCRARNAITDA
ncbi:MULTISPECIES: hypothetical protein [unclassified Burkholderia]|uniref:hypothetical protein n=1 Tax=unclassified Burkholderia TaxID=2613784 RepID=UPI001E562AB8|nr:MULTISPECIES: hypothetical protein [unclassified Burkholderia]UEP32048.1 hypothetical protein LMA01_22980 [Burkholderia sp. B21-007]UEP45365.1 hypothetical protein LMA02_21800 [Burkholderia sp. B21-005]